MRAALKLDTSLLKPGLRLAVGLSGGADSVALLRALADRKAELGLVLHAAHLHHGLRGDEADADLEFSRKLAADFGLTFHEARVDTEAEARTNSESIEEAARRLRYAWFRKLLSEVPLDAVATAHTLDDQAETVLAKFLRGAWTEGLSGIHPVLEFPEGHILRPLLATTRAEVEAYLKELGQAWREDSTNRHLTYTRNRIRHELLPLLETWNPRLREHMAEMASLARDEECYWRGELARIASQLLLPGRPVRGGGRAGGDDPTQSLSIDVTRLAALPPAVQRRLLRHASAPLGSALDFASTESLRSLALSGRAGQKLELVKGFRAERTPRELRLSASRTTQGNSVPGPIPAYTVTIPGEVDAAAFGIRLRIELTGGSALPGSSTPPTASLRNWKPGDRVRLRHSASPRKVKEVLERLRVTGSSREVWPVLELAGSIVWMQGVEVEPPREIRVVAAAAGDGAGSDFHNGTSGAG